MNITFRYGAIILGLWMCTMRKMVQSHRVVMVYSIKQIIQDDYFVVVKVFKGMNNIEIMVREYCKVLLCGMTLQEMCTKGGWMGESNGF